MTCQWWAESIVKVAGWVSPIAATTRCGTATATIDIVRVLIPPP